MDLKSLVSEFQKSDSLKLENAELTYSSWAAQQTSSQPQKSSANERPSKVNPISSEIPAIRKEINEALATLAHGPSVNGHADSNVDLLAKVATLETDSKHMKSEIKDLKELINKLQATVNKLTLGGAGGDADKKPATKPKEADDEIDLFGSDDEQDEEANKIKEQRLKAYEEKKSKKPGLIAKSSVILDIKPWDDETDMAETEKLVRSIVMDGLLWGASKLVPVGYGIKKLQIMSVVEDDKVSVEELQEKIEAFEDFVQSVDIAAFNKI